MNFLKFFDICTYSIMFFFIFHFFLLKNNYLVPHLQLVLLLSDYPFLMSL